MSLEDAQNLAPRDALHLGNPVRVTEDNTDLRRRQTFLRELADVVLDLQQSNPSISRETAKPKHFNSHER